MVWFRTFQGVNVVLFRCKRQLHSLYKLSNSRVWNRYKRRGSHWGKDMHLTAKVQESISIGDFLPALRAKITWWLRCVCLIKLSFKMSNNFFYKFLQLCCANRWEHVCETKCIYNGWTGNYMLWKHISCLNHPITKWHPVAQCNTM